MNCLEFRRRTLQDPMDEQPSLLVHEKDCPQCARFARETRAQEIRLRALLRDVAAPPELADRIQLAVHFEHRRSPRQRIWFAMAASILVMIGVSMTSLVSTSWERGNMALAESVLSHIEDEARHLHETGPANPQRISDVFARFGARPSNGLGRVNFVAECVMRNKTGVHLVLGGKKGPITVFFMPGEHIAHSSELNSPRFKGELLPTAWGTIAVLGEKGENLTEVAARMQQAVEWPGSTQAITDTSGIIDIGGFSGALAVQQQNG